MVVPLVHELDKQIRNNNFIIRMYKLFYNLNSLLNFIDSTITVQLDQLN